MGAQCEDYVLRKYPRTNNIFAPLGRGNVCQASVVVILAVIMINFGENRYAANLFFVSLHYIVVAPYSGNTI